MAAITPARELFDLSGEVALVTGASSGLGARFAEVLSAHGAKVALVARRLERIEKAAARLGNAVAVAFDVARHEKFPAVLDRAEKALGPVNLLINNAGWGGKDKTFEHSPEDWRKLQSTNVDAVWHLSQIFAQRLIGRGAAGSIINISSVAGYLVSETPAPYAITKAAVVQMTRALGLELARHKIRVNGIAPGYIHSEMTDDYLASEAGKAMIKRVPQRRAGDPSDLDGTLLLLASPKASGFMTGSTVIVDGGIALK
jgi:NAD(P)-dependent dehydrogenase (short-subunit alcohol dehydrogenase family)